MAGPGWKPHTPPQSPHTVCLPRPQWDNLRELHVPGQGSGLHKQKWLRLTDSGEYGRLDFLPLTFVGAQGLCLQGRLPFNRLHQTSAQSYQGMEI